MIITFLELIINKKYCVNDDETDKKKEKKSNKILYLIFILKYFFYYSSFTCTPICNIDQHAKKVSFKNKIFISTMNILFVLIVVVLRYYYLSLYNILLNCGKYEE